MNDSISDESQEVAHKTVHPEDILTSDHVTDTTVWINTANLFGMCRIHLHLPTKEESLNKTDRDVTMHEEFHILKRKTYIHTI